MIHKDDAARISSEVRDFYAAGKKSGNKVYMTNIASTVYAPIAMDFFEPVFDAQYQNWSTTMLAQKATRRNQNATLALGSRPKRGKQSFYDFGKGIYNGGKRAAFTSGHCGEMAAVSSVIAIDNYHIAPQWVYVVELEDPGDHAFCLLSMRKPKWSNPSRMVDDASGALVIDPWLNTVCLASEYWAAAQARLAKWAQDGKRVAWSGLDGTCPGWYCPGSNYAWAFGVSPLTFIPAKAEPT